MHCKQRKKFNFDIAKIAGIAVNCLKLYYINYTSKITYKIKPVSIEWLILNTIKLSVLFMTSLYVYHPVFTTDFKTNIREGKQGDH